MNIIEKLENPESLRVLWLSRHELGEDQITDLAKSLGVNPKWISVETKNICWQASADEAADIAANEATWLDFLLPNGAGEVDFDIVAGVFPPVALEAKPDGFTNIWTPVSVPNPEARRKEGAIPFLHARWMNL